MIWITSDFHFCHNKEFIYGPRGFINVYNMNEEIIKRYNSVVHWSDEVYILGDCMLNDDRNGISYLNQLNGYKYIILGNHDSANRISLYRSVNGVVSIEWGYRLKHNGWIYILSHYPQITENYQEKHKVISLCGHSHTKDPFLHWDQGLIYHCEVDAHDLYPVSIDQIEMDIRQKLKI